MSNKRYTPVLKFLTILGTIFLAAVVGPLSIPAPVQGALVGLVCVAPSPVTSNSGCPSSPPNIAGGAVGTKLIIGINIQDSDALNGFRIFVKTDNTVLNPLKADTNNTVLLQPILPLSNCVNGKGTACSLSAGDGPGVVDVGVVSIGGLNIPPVTGNLFEIVYQVVTPTTGTPINFLTGTCSNGSSVPGLCVTITNGGGTSALETAQTGTVITLPSFVLSASATSLTVTSSTPGSSVITANSFLAGTGTITLTSPVTPIKTNGPTTSLNPTSISLTSKITSATSTLTITAGSSTPPGNYNVNVTGTCTTSSCNTAIHFIIIQVTIPPPSISVDITSITPSTPEVGTSVTFTATGTGGTAPFSFVWTFGDGGPTTTTTINTATHTYTTASTFSATVQITDSLGATATSPTHSVVVAPPFTAVTFTVNPTSPIVNSPVAFGATPTGGAGPFSYSWTFGDTGASTTNPATHTFMTAGPFTVAVTATDASSVQKMSSQTVTVQKASPSITTALSPSTTIGIAGSASDTATLTGGFQPGGTVTYYLFVVPNVGCTGTVHTVSIVTVTNGVVPPSRSITFNNTVTQSFGWNATYSGDANNNPAKSTCEILTVTAAKTFLITSSPTTVSFQVGTTSSTNTITITITSVNGFTGKVTITNSTSPSTGLGLTCSQNPVPVTISGGSTTCTFSSMSARTYSVLITGTNSSTVVKMVSPITVTVTQASPALTTKLSTTTITLNSAPQSTIDTATLSGGFSPTGTISFQVFGPNDNKCYGPSVTLQSPVSVIGNGPYPSTPFTPVRGAGTYQFVVSYSGDGNNTKVAATVCGSEPFTVNLANPVVSTTIYNATSNPPAQLADGTVISQGTTVYDGAAISLAFNPTGSVIYSLFGTADCTGSARTTTVTVSGSTLPNSDSWNLLFGFYSFKAVYGGDGNNTQSSGPCEHFTVNALPIATFAISGSAPYLVHQNLSFNATASSDPDASVLHDKIVSYSWSFGDGKSASGNLTSHTYTVPGDYIVTLTLNDTYASVSTSLTIHVDTLTVQLSAVPSTNSTSVGKIVIVTVDLTNGGSLGLNVTVTLDVNGKTVDQKTLVLAANKDSGPFTLKWDTTSYNAGTYSVTIRIANAKTLGSQPASVSIPGGVQTLQVALTAASGVPSLPGGPVPWVILGVIVVIAVASYLLLRRRKTQTV